MPFSKIPIIRRLGVPYTPRPDERPFLERLQAQAKNDVEVKIAVLGSRESDRFFGVPLARRGIQPVWVEVHNQTDGPIFFDRVRLDPNYYPPREAALVSHFAIGKRLAGYGLLAWVFLPLLIFLPLKFFGARRANRRMDDYFCDHAFPLGPVGPGQSASGFVFASLDDGTKIVPVHLLSPETTHQFVFSVPVPGIDVDYERRPFDELYTAESLIDCDELSLRDRLEKEPRAVTNRSGTREGDPANLVVIGDFPTLLSAFGARWDETETISLATSWKTAKAFLFGSRYRYSPVSPLFLYNRSQDFALQRARHTINERLHLRLWLTPLRFEGKSVWVGQVSRDIGVRFTPRTWNLTTHRIDSAVDEARDYVVADLLESGHLDRMGYVEGVGISEASAPRCNLTGDPYVTDGNRAVAILSPSKTAPKFLGWYLQRHTAKTPADD
ncbi:MAG: LssY C-terminal domain-containing protein [Planctomycetota bacterium]|nr:LssY C-terminal domain-containing protein [Planctomycetota bacterium]